jgi:2-succinyl-6-hydroxy-2,4-cyclohexadiene-1-carboxylate synthase
MSACEYAPACTASIDESVAAGASGSATKSRDVALVLLHGFTGSHEVWEPIVARASAAHHALGDLRIVAVDLPGHGASRFSNTGGYAMESAAVGLERTLDALGIGKPILVGYSLGGRLALYFTITRPARVGALLLESASAGLATAAERTERQRRDEELARTIESDGVTAFVDRWERLPLFATRGDDAEGGDSGDAARDHQRGIRLSCSADGLAASLRGMGTGSQPWLGDRLDELTMPVLLVTGAADDKFTKLAAAMVTRIGDARHEVVESAGHAVHVEQPERFVALLDGFVERVRTGIEEHRGGTR